MFMDMASDFKFMTGTQMGFVPLLQNYILGGHVLNNIQTLI